MDFKANFEQLMAQAKEMQDKMQSAQQSLLEMTVIGEAGGGMVKIEYNGSNEAKRVKIVDAAMSDREMLEGLIAAAINDGKKKVERATQDRMADITKGMQLPEGFQMPGIGDDKGKDGA